VIPASTVNSKARIYNSAPSGADLDASISENRLNALSELKETLMENSSQLSETSVNSEMSQPLLSELSALTTSA